MKEKRERGELALLILTGLFLCVLLGLFLHDSLSVPKEGLAVRTAAGGPEAVEAMGDTVAAGDETGLLNVNTAGAEELTRLPGIGEELARRIVAYREEHGPFASVEELTQVPGIGAGKLAGIRDSVTAGKR